MLKRSYLRWNPIIFGYVLSSNFLLMPFYIRVNQLLHEKLNTYTTSCSTNVVLICHVRRAISNLFLNVWSIPAELEWIVNFKKRSNSYKLTIAIKSKHNANSILTSTKIMQIIMGCFSVCMKSSFTLTKCYSPF